MTFRLPPYFGDSALCKAYFFFQRKICIQKKILQNQYCLNYIYYHDKNLENIYMHKRCIL